MKLLAIDSATEACSAAVWIDGAVLARYEVIGRGHAERLLPMVDELLTESGLGLSHLDAIAFGRGPGAFTGVRIAVGLAQGLAFGADLPVVPVSNLAALARLALDRHAAVVTPSPATHGAQAAPARALVCLDARMSEVYWAEAAGRADGGIDLLTERLGAPTAVQCQDDTVSVGGSDARAVVAAGHGWSAYPVLRERFPQLAACWPDLLPRAHEIAALAALEAAAGRTVRAEDASPVYLRDDVATRSGRGPSKTPGPR
jgi:tRNA threonylcarbamoyladenosine biosynthesis protein TsaB